MAGNPQLEDGYFKVANEMAEAFAKADLEASDFRILWFILRKTWGWKKKMDYIALSQIVEGTGLSERGVCKSLKRLKAKHVLERSNTGTMLNKRYTKWALNARTEGLSHSSDGGLNAGTVASERQDSKSLNAGTDTKDNKDTNTKDNYSEVKPRLVDSGSENNLGKPYKIHDDIGRVVAAYKRVIGYPIDDRAWDKIYQARCRKPAKELLEFLGTWEIAFECIRDIASSFKEKNLNFTLETILSHAGDWKLKSFEAQNGLLSS